MAKQLFFDFYQDFSKSNSIKTSNNCHLLSSDINNNRQYLQRIEKKFILSHENQDAYKKVRDFQLQQNFLNSAFPSLILEGPEACGKSLLLQEFRVTFNSELFKRSHTKLLDSNNLQTNLFVAAKTDDFLNDLINRFEPNHHFLIDNANEIDEEDLLFLLNFAAEKSSFLIISLPVGWFFKLPDLASRVKNIPRASILKAEIDLLLQILTQNLALSQIILEPKLIDIIKFRANRTYKSFSALAKKIEFFCQETAEKLSATKLEEFFN